MPVDQSKLAIKMMEKRVKNGFGCESQNIPSGEDCAQHDVPIFDRCYFCQDEAVAIWMRALHEENSALHRENKDLHMRLVGTDMDNHFARAMKPRTEVEV